MTRSATIYHNNRDPIDESLGSGMARYKSRHHKWRGFLGFLSLLTLALLLANAFAIGYLASIQIEGQLPLIDSPALVLLLFPFAIIYLHWLVLLRSYQHTGHFLEIYQHGVKLSLPKIGRTVLLWEEIDGIAVSLVELHFLGLPSPVHWRAWIYLRKGKPIEICPEIDNFPEVISRLKAAVYPSLMKQYRSDFLDSKPIKFGRIILYSDHVIITSPARRQKKLRWSEIVSLAVDKGYLLLQPLHGRRIRLPASSIPNLELLIEFVKQDIRI